MLKRNPQTRRALLTASAAAVLTQLAAGASSVPMPVEARPDAELLRLAAEYDASEVALEPILFELGRAENAYFAIDMAAMLEVEA